MTIGNLTSRREFIVGALGGVGLLLPPGLLAAPAPKRIAKPLTLYVGTYTSKKSRGIYVLKFNDETGEVVKALTVENVIEPSFLAIGKSRKYLYCVNETEEFQGKRSGAVSSFAIDRRSGDLKVLNTQPSLGGAPCHISVSADERFVLVANYLGGNVSVFPVERDGRLGTSVDLVQHSGSGANVDRQRSAHAHSIILDEGGRFAFASDLGSDKIFIYRFDRRTGNLEPNSAQPFFQTRPGAGPRHFVFHQSGRFAFVINELDATITSLAYETRRGTLTEIQTVRTLPSDFSGSNTCADIHVSPDGKFVYGSNRGHDSIVVFKLDEATGRLRLVEHVSTGGNTPRNFTLSPSGRFLLAANQNSDSIVVFRVDEESGKLSRTKFEADVPTPVCLKLISL